MSNFIFFLDQHDSVSVQNTPFKVDQDHALVRFDNNIGGPDISMIYIMPMQFFECPDDVSLNLSIDDCFRQSCTLALSTRNLGTYCGRYLDEFKHNDMTESPAPMRN